MSKICIVYDSRKGENYWNGTIKNLPKGNTEIIAEMIGGLARAINGTIIQCCTAYNGRRTDPQEHWKAIVRSMG